MRKINKKVDKQITGNIGLYYVCYQLSKLGWIVMPTSRNTKGVDIIICSQDLRNKYAIEVKSLSGKNAVGVTRHGIISDFIIICRFVYEDKPEIFIASKEQAKSNIDKKEKNGKISYWIEYKNYEQFQSQLDIIESFFE